MSEEALTCLDCGKLLTEDELFQLTGQICFSCAKEAREEYLLENPPRKLTRNEALQMAADRGYDTWDDYNGDK